MGKYQDWAEKRALEIDRIRDEGCAMAQNAASLTPSATVGILTDGFPAWTPGETYTQGQLFRYDGKTGFVRQPSVTAMEHQPPFSPGMESVYGVRPKPDIDGIYPYIYNMAASVGMRVREENNVYYCYNAIDVMIYPPSALPAHFRIDTEGGV